MNKYYYKFSLDGDVNGSDFEIKISDWILNEKGEFIDTSIQNKSFSKDKMEKRFSSNLDFYFLWTLEQTSDVKPLMMYHYNNYEGEKIDFLNYSEIIIQEEIVRLIDPDHAINKLRLENAVKWIREEINILNNIKVKTEFKKLKWNDDLNKLTTLFFELTRRQTGDKSTLETNPENLIKFILASFLDKNGNEIKRSVIDTYLKPERNETRSKKNKLDFDELTQT